MKSHLDHCRSVSPGTRASVLLLCLGLPLAILAWPALAAGEEEARTPARADRSAEERRARHAEVGRWSVRAGTRADGVVVSAPTGPAFGMRFVVETGPVAFGEVIPDRDSLLNGALVVRVFSDRDWRLMLQPSEPLRSLDRGGMVPLSRLAWRSRGSGRHTPFQDRVAVTVASGPRTSGAGALVAVDLLLRIVDEDPLGAYGTSFRLELAPN